MRSGCRAGGRGVGYLGVALAWGFVAVGSYVTLRRPDRRTGVLMIAVGLVTLTAGLQFSDARAAVAGGRADRHARPGACSCTSCWRSRRAGSRGVAERLVVGAGYVVATAAAAAAAAVRARVQLRGQRLPAQPAAGRARAGRRRHLRDGPDAGRARGDRVRARRSSSGAGARRAAVQRRGLAPVLGLGAAIVALGAVSYAAQELDVGGGGRAAPVPVRARAAAARLPRRAGAQPLLPHHDGRAPARPAHGRHRGDAGARSATRSATRR